ncbi:MAG: transposase [Endomicrobium sp.]|jgi:transposase|nr:transposase [Endomicrobium sp.]
MYQTYIGIDIAKSKIDIAFNKKIYTIKNNAIDIEKFIINLKIDKSKTLIAIDLTGGLEVIARDCFYNNDFKNIVLCEGFKVKRFSQSIKHHNAKTDKQDAFLLIEYAKTFEKDLINYCPNNQLELIKLFNRIESLKQYKSQEKIKLSSPNLTSFLKQQINDFITYIDNDIKNTTQQLKDLINSSIEKKEIYDYLLTIKGIGQELALTLLSTLPELGHINKSKISAICGVAPIPNESGKTIFYRKTRGGRPLIKKKLFMAVLSMIRYNQEFQNKIKSMVARGKSKKTCIMALMRKFIIIINAKVRDVINNKLIIS